MLKLITAYRSRGHLQANLDPLGMVTKPDAPDLEIGFHGLSEADLDVEFSTSPRGGTSRSVTVLRWRRFTSGRSCQGMSCMME